LGAASSAARAFLGLGRVAGMVMGMVTRGAGARTAAGAGSSPKGSGAGQLVKVDGAGLGCGGAGRALAALARLSTGSGGLFLELGVLIGSRANGVLGTSSVGPPSSRTAALSLLALVLGFRPRPRALELGSSDPGVPPSLLSPVSLLVFRLRRLALGTRRAGDGSAHWIL